MKETHLRNRRRMSFAFVVLMVLWTLVCGGMTVYKAWKWLAFDEPDVSYACVSPRGGIMTCFRGEENNRDATIASAVIWFAGLTGLVRMYQQARPAPAETSMS